MKGRKPQTSRLKRAFILAAATLGLGAGVATLDNLPKNPVTDTQTISTVNAGQWDQAGINISPSDQMWKHTLSMRSDDARSAALMQAAQSGDSWRVQALFDNGVSPRSAAANDALVAAAYAGHMDVFNAMMHNGVDPTANDNAALVAAVAGGNNGIAYRLMDYGARGDAQDSEALLIAAFRGDNSMVQSLLQNGADPSARDGAAMKYTEIWGYSDVASTLQQAIDARAQSSSTGAMGPFLADSDAGFTPWNYRGPGYIPGPFSP